MSRKPVANELDSVNPDTAVLGTEGALTGAPEGVSVDTPGGSEAADHG